VSQVAERTTAWGVGSGEAKAGGGNQSGEGGVLGLTSHSQQAAPSLKTELLGSLIQAHFLTLEDPV
jgi:hypothetical protein